MLKVWGNDDHSNLFPFFKFGDANSFVRLLRFMHHHHHTYAHIFVDSTINRMDLLTISIITIELKDPLDEKVTSEIFRKIEYYIKSYPETKKKLIGSHFIFFCFFYTINMDNQSLISIRCHSKKNTYST